MVHARCIVPGLDYPIGFRRYSSPFCFISYSTDNRTPILPGGKPFWWNHIRYGSGRLQRMRSLYFPNGMRIDTNSTNIRESKDEVPWFWSMIYTLIPAYFITQPPAPQPTPVLSLNVKITDLDGPFIPACADPATTLKRRGRVHL